MKDSDLDKKLRAVRVPERSEEYWDAFPRTVLGRLSRDEERTERHPRSAGIPWLLRGLGTAFACMAVVITIGYWRKDDRHEWTDAGREDFAGAEAPEAINVEVTIIGARKWRSVTVCEYRQPQGETGPGHRTP